MEKLANIIVVGGTSAVGKSTLVESLGLPKIDEHDLSDPLQEAMLENTYSHTRIALEVIEFYFLERRKDLYQKFSNTLVTHIFDRSIIETYIFAQYKLSEKSMKHFTDLFDAEVRDLFEEFGKPKLYLILTCSWDAFYERIMKRARGQEVGNFAKNAEFWRLHVETYEKDSIRLMEQFGINYKVIDTTNMTPEQVLETAQKYIAEVE